MRDLVSGYTANEPGEFLRLSHSSLPDLFNDGPEDLLIEVICDCRVADFPANDDHHAAAVTFDQFDLGLSLAGPNAIYEPAPPPASLMCRRSTFLLFFGLVCKRNQ
jgi:hypothetical protein